MNYDFLFAIIFYGFLILYFLRNKEKVDMQNKIFFIYRTKLGLKWMDIFSRKFPRFLKFISYLSISIGFLGMLVMSYILIEGALKVLFIPSAPPTIAPVFPGISIPGIPSLSFWHWIIAIFITAAVHEFSHGVFSRLSKVNVKSSGLALLGPILAAFVEPDETEMRKKPVKEQLSIFSAGPFANIVLGFLFALIFFLVAAPLEAKIIDYDGIIVNEIVEGYPAEELGIETPFTIIEINGNETTNVYSFNNAVVHIKPNQNITFRTNDRKIYEVTTATNPENISRGYIGFSNFEQSKKTKGNWPLWIIPVVDWIVLLIIWLFLINIGVGLFNLLPLGPVDGGRMFYLLAQKFSKRNAMKIFQITTLIFMFFIFINLIPWFVKLLNWFVNSLLSIIGLLL